jgi:hypothetical protein
MFRYMCPGLGKFFGLNGPSGLRRDVVNAALARLRSLEAWFLRQRAYAFYASSLLFIYSNHQAGDSTAASSHVDNGKQQFSPMGDAVSPATTGLNVGEKSDQSVQSKRNMSDRIAGVEDSEEKRQSSELNGKGAELSVTEDVNVVSDSNPRTLNLATGQKRTCTEADVDLDQGGAKQARTAPASALSQGEKGKLSNSSLVEVRMIDFAHVFPAKGKRDDNYLVGLQNLISYLEQLLKL